jgi:hypothetical protein
MRIGMTVERSIIVFNPGLTKTLSSSSSTLLPALANVDTAVVAGLRLRVRFEAIRVFGARGPLWWLLNALGGNFRRILGQGLTPAEFGKGGAQWSVRDLKQPPNRPVEFEDQKDRA